MCSGKIPHSFTGHSGIGNHASGWIITHYPPGWQVGKRKGDKPAHVHNSIIMSTVFVRSDTAATIYFTPRFVWLLFEGGIYFFGKPGDIDSWIRYVR